MQSMGATVEFLSENMTFKAGDDDPFAKLQLHMLGAIAEFERSLIRKRQREGIDKARAKGTYKGSKPWLDYDAVQKLDAEGVSKVQIARRLGISRQSVHRILRQDV
jgi:DNA invertase Pin-like site-specific DNA recombinase